MSDLKSEQDRRLIRAWREADLADPVRGAARPITTDDPSATPGSVPALRRPRSEAPSRAPDWRGSRTALVTPNLRSGTVLYRRIQRRHLPAAAAPVRAPLVWPRGRRRPPMRRFTARVGRAGVVGMASRAPAPVDQAAPFGIAVTPGLSPDGWRWVRGRPAGALCIPFTSRSHGASVQALDWVTRQRSRSVATVALLRLRVNDSKHVLSPKTFHPGFPRTCGRDGGLGTAHRPCDESAHSTPRLRSGMGDGRRPE